MNVIEVAKLLNISPQSLRLGLQRNELPFGSAIKTSSRYTYVFYEKKLSEFLDLEVKK